MAPILNQLKDSGTKYSLTAVECSWVASLHYVTRGIGPLFAAALIDRVGRNPILIAIACFYFLMWVILISIRSVVGHYTARLIYGLAIGMFEATAGLYVSETCSVKLRGRFSGVIAASFYAGELTAFILATYISYENVAIVHAGLGLITVISTVLLKEPAQFLIMKGNMEKAEKNYNWLRGSNNANTESEFEEMKENVLEEKSRVSLSELFHDQVVRKSLRIIVLIMSLMMCTGFPAVSSFVTMVFAKSDHLTSNEFTAIFGFLQLITSCASWFTMDKFNRRTYMLTACALISIIHAGTAALYYAQNSFDVPYFDWLLFSMLSAYACVFGMAVFPLTMAIRGELLPQSVKGIGACFYVIGSSLTGFGIAKTFLPVAEIYGVQANFILFSVNSLIMFVYVYFELPETRGKTLVAIQMELRKMKKSDVNIFSVRSSKT